MSLVSQPSPPSPAVTPTRRARRKRLILRDIPWKLYLRLRKIHENRHIHMTYLDGTLELMAPEFRHEIGAERLSRLIWAVTEECDIPCCGAPDDHLRAQGTGRTKRSRQGTRQLVLFRQRIARPRQERHRPTRRSTPRPGDRSQQHQKLDRQAAGLRPSRRPRSLAVRRQHRRPLVRTPDRDEYL